MPVTFTAKTARGLVDENDVLSVGWEGEAGEYVLISRYVGDPDPSMEPDEHHVELSDQSRACYKGIQAVELKGNKAEIHLRPEGESALQAQGGISITYGPEMVVTDEFKQMLSTALKGDAEISEIQ